MSEGIHQEGSFEPSYSLIPDIIEEPEKKTEERQIIKDERDANGNGYVEIFMEAAPMRTNGPTHHFKVGYEVTDKPGGIPGKRWQKVAEAEDFGPVPETKTIQ
jgi:hypothetical protein